MRWLSVLCTTAVFKPWLQFDHHIKRTLLDIESMLPDKRFFLDAYLSSSRPIVDHPLLEEDGTDSIETVPDCSIADSVEIVLAALESHPTYVSQRRTIISSEYGHAYSPESGGVIRTNTIRPTLAIYRKQKAPTACMPPSVRPDSLPIASVMQLQDDAILCTDHTRTSSARAMAASYNDIFSNDRHADSFRDEFHQIRRVMQVVATAVSHAMLSQSGCAAITNGRAAVLFKVEANVRDGVKTGIVVYVTRVFNTASQHVTGGPVPGIVSLLRHALEMVDKAPETAKEMRECVLCIANCATAKSFSFDTLRTCKRPLKRLGLDAEDNENDGIIDHLLRNHEGVMGVGSSSVMLRAQWEGRCVLVKYWNEAEQDGLATLLDEIRIYQKLQREHGDVLGSVVPRLIAFRDDPMPEVTLVTEKVGKGLRRREDGCLLVGEGAQWEEVEEGGKEGILSAATESLKRLHGCGIAHGDIALRNLRVERCKGGLLRKEGWRAWWVDLGHGEDGCDMNCTYEFDLFQCEMRMLATLLDEKHARTVPQCTQRLR